jgi:transcriptional regulator with XRE-family HTH domain
MSDKKDFYTAIGRLVRAAREQAGLTQDGLACGIGLTRPSITNIEKGRQKLLLHTFYDLAATLGIAPAALLPKSRKPAAERVFEHPAKLPKQRRRSG